MRVEELPIVFHCQTDQLVGVIHKPVSASKRGVLIVVGGPQYRVGSHRQFVLLARYLACNGIPVMRFDYRGMGDSEGETVSFLNVDNDIKSAIDAFYQHFSSLSSVVIWGLCDAASAALFYAYQDDRVEGLVLLNPWVFTEQGAAKTYLKHYYLQRILSGALWRKVFCLQFDYRKSFSSFFSLLISTLTRKDTNKSVVDPIALVDSNLSLPVRMRECLNRFQGSVLLILSGRDLTAKEFVDLVKSDIEWQKLLADEKIMQYTLKEADHTFSSSAWHEKIEEVTLFWLGGLKSRK